MRRRWLIVLAVVSFIGGALVNGIIGNLGTEALQLLWSNLTASIKADWWPWGLTIFSIAGLSYFWIVNRIQRHALITSNNLLELDDSLLRLLASWIPKKAHDTEMQLILAELLQDACREFGHHVHKSYTFA